MSGRRALAGLAALVLLTGCATGGPAPTASSPVPSTAASPAVATPAPTSAASPSNPPLVPVPTAPTPPPSGSASLAPLPAEASALREFYAQRPTWQRCGTDVALECATVRVPLDYAIPRGRSIELGLARRKAKAGPRLGSLFVNPGGPGGSGTGYVSLFSSKGLERYDIVGWDPRGVGSSVPLQCANGAAAERFLALDLSPESAAERAELLRGTKAFADSCLRGSGDVLAHISTQENARDLDIIRAALGETRVTYVGQSYGTMLGAYYAQLFPGRVGRLVLDAGVDVTGTAGITPTLGFDRALNSFADACLLGGCRWGTSRADVIGSIRKLLDDLDAHPVAVGDRQLTQSRAATGMAAMLYAGTLATPVLDTALDRLRHGDGRMLMMAADELYGRDKEGNYGGLLGPFQAIQCADARPTTVEQAERQWAIDRQRAPFFGYLYGPQVMCAQWPVKTAGPLEKVDGAGAPPIVVVGGRNDPTTPYEESVDLARHLRSSVLVTFEGEGHVAYGGKSACIDTAVRDYLNAGIVPKAGLTCS
ncbi:alpha/beta hydrolase [Nigerium massiliense]|uniref:alpha/beta hydrolase n=1 Tax=Nigerium massiliense TaxID=1522317 RepID=UPI00069377D3|nr:alpha/beta hydrolase [Nigerium massiliense]